jgi:excisionase family DNA binding protein
MELLDYDEAAKLLGVRRGTMYAWVSQRRVPFIRFSARCVRFDRAELQAWVEEHRVKPGAPRSVRPRSGQ